MMYINKQIFIFLLLLGSISSIRAQENSIGLDPLTINLSLKNQYKEIRNVSSFSLRGDVLKDTVVYDIDTISLPFFDDFSTNKYKKYQFDILDPGISNLNYPYVLQGGIPVLPDTKYSSLITYRYQYDSVDGDEVLTAVPQGSFFIDTADFFNYPISYFSLVAYPPYDLIDTLWNISDVPDTVFVINDDQLVQQTSKTFYNVPDNGKLSIWMDNFTFISSELPINPPTINVASFDGADEYGQMYSESSTARGIADYLTSKPIDLSIGGNDIYISFFYQTIGNSADVTVNPDDSLVLEFYNPILNDWDYVWSSIYFSQEDFKQQIIHINNPLYHYKGFQFRFKNYGSLSGVRDLWYLDYVFLDKNRSEGDTIYDDLAMQYNAPSLLNGYTAMLWRDYLNDPDSRMISEVFTPFRNNDDAPKILIDLQYQISNKDVPTHIENIGGGSSASIAANTSSGESFDIYNNFNYIFNTSIPADSTPIFNLAFSVSTSTPNDTLLSNDTCYYNQVFNDYYAYDDGSAEAQLFVTSAQVYPQIALEYTTFNTGDTLKALDICFIPNTSDPSIIPFTLAVWDDLNNNPYFENVSYSYPSYGQGTNNFQRYYFEDFVNVTNQFYVGIKQKEKSVSQSEGINIGFDLNTNNTQGKIYYVNDVGETFKQFSVEGSLMIRPVFKMGINDSVLSVKELTLQDDFKIFPNPSNGFFNIEVDDKNKNYLINVLDISGRLILKSTFKNNTVVNISNNQKGLYFLKIQDKETGAFAVKKIIKN